MEPETHNENITMGTPLAHCSSIDKGGLKPYIIAWESELQYMTGLAVGYGCIETGGEVYGLLSQAGRPVIMLATPPGPGAIHNEAHFRQDMDSLKQNSSFLYDFYGIQYLGNWHSHHTLNIKGLSSGDIQSTHSIAARNNYYRLCQFVLTFEGNALAGFPSRRYCARSKRSPFDERTKIPATAQQYSSGAYRRTAAFHSSIRQVDLIRVHSFLYQDARHSQPCRCPIRIIPGTSPIRHALQKNSSNEDLIKPISFPMQRIIYDTLKPAAEPSDSNRELPSRLQRQFLCLSDNVREHAMVSFKEGMILLSLPIPSKNGKVIIIYKNSPPHEIEAVYFMPNNQPGRPIDLTSEARIFGPYMRLRTIYNRIHRYLRKEWKGNAFDFNQNGGRP
jgi:hypothetical protein